MERSSPGVGEFTPGLSPEEDEEEDDEILSISIDGEDDELELSADPEE